MEAALLPDELTDFVSTNIGWDVVRHFRNWQISKPSSEPSVQDGYDYLPVYELQQIY